VFWKIRSKLAVVQNLLQNPETISIVTNLKESLQNTKWNIKNFENSKDAIDKLVDQVNVLCFNFGNILYNTSLLMAGGKDIEQMVDLYHAIAFKYTFAPELIVTWLENLSKYHEEHANMVEAGICMVHAAMLISAHLVAINPLSSTALLLPTKNMFSFPKLIFTYLCNYYIPVQVTLDISQGHEVTEVFSPTFNDDGLITILQKAIKYFDEANFYESSQLLYKMLLNIYEHKRNYLQLCEIYKNLQASTTKTIDSNDQQLRYFGTYYRVSFYGKKFGELDHKEFIYKEPKLTMLPEITQRLKDTYTPTVEDEPIVLDSSADVEKSLDPHQHYIQITKVDPYFDETEKKERLTYFERNTNLTRFVFVTPYTLSGKVHGELEEQYLRKTVVTVELPFPNMKRRIQIVAKESFTLSPIEYAIEQIQGQNEKINSVIGQNNPKLLQQNLSGSLIAQVNAGPMKIAETFLVNTKGYTEEHLQQLRESLVKFLKVCNRGIILNATFIKDDQKAFQKQLEQGYTTLKLQMKPLLLDEFDDDLI